MRRWLRSVPKFSLVGGIAVGLVVFLFAFTLQRTQDISRQNCQEIELVKDRIRIVVRVGLAALGRPGSAGYQYYLLHPVELAQAREGLQRELQEFAPDRCT